MILAVVAFIGGMLTILSPCILPVLPFVFTRAEGSFVKNALPLLAGMVLTFVVVATLAAAGGTWAAQFNQYGRWLALALLAVFALALLSERVATELMQPLVNLGNRLLSASESANAAGADKRSVVNSLLLGVATGLLWAPCAGPILGLILTGAVAAGPSAHTSLLLLAYAAGAAVSLALALFAGGRVLAALRRSLGAGEWIRRVMGVVVLLAVVAIACGWDTGVLTQLSLSNTTQLEQRLLDQVQPAGEQVAANDKPAAMMMGGPAMMAGGNAMMAGGNGMMMKAGAAAAGAPIEGQLPPLTATAWLNTMPLTPDDLRGKVVVIDFWTYSCINCLRALPYVKAWQQKYRDQGLVVIGVHTPEFAFEKSERNVNNAVRDLGVDYPVALDNDYAIWRAFNNQFWPAHYFIDATGSIRGHHFGEGGYEESEQVIRHLLMEAGADNLPPAQTTVTSAGVQAASDQLSVQSPETYVGYERGESFSSPGGVVQDQAHAYQAPAAPALNQWGLAGEWTVSSDKAVLNGKTGKIVFRFLARDLHLVLGPKANGEPVKFRVLLDGVPPARNHGLDIDEQGNGTVTQERLYQLVRQQDVAGEHVFTIEFLDSGVQAYSFTFG
ncbi:MAG TPA: cytochrome c biogenesis protein DipZ [Candidatus Acidoferrum sp.]|nr:cytochrome c biogenesis protein DipZ [Candidatus Acidoferrum sp.]